jgi:3'-phosphoadenosine 5'-phosphosulfate sulfotransferase (PAPS reductase)/FAD synthetase
MTAVELAPRPADQALTLNLDGTFADLVRRYGALDLTGYDLIIINSSAGKDSQAMLAFLVWLADRQGFPRSRILVVHADLGRVEWQGTRELAEEQAHAYGLAFATVSRAEDLLDQVETRRRTLDADAVALDADAEALRAAGWVRFAELAAKLAQAKRDTPAWPSSSARYCTSDQKTAQVVKLMTEIVRSWYASGETRPMRILNTLGIRGEESPARAKKDPLTTDPASNTRRHVTRWLPIFEWTAREVWAVIYASGLRWHSAYDRGMPRLSCVFCVLAGRKELVIAARENPGLAAEYIRVERAVGHTFQAGASIEGIAAEAGVTVPAEVEAPAARPAITAG